jgi:hypothetical protein
MVTVVVACDWAVSYVLDFNGTVYFWSNSSLNVTVSQVRGSTGLALDLQPKTSSSVVTTRPRVSFDFEVRYLPVLQTIEEQRLFGYESAEEWFDHLGFHIIVKMWRKCVCFVALGVPHWFLLAVLFVPAWRAHRRRRRRRLRMEGRCLVCGYDLRESPTICPECGSLKIRAEKGNPDMSSEQNGGATGRHV